MIVQVVRTLPDLERTLEANVCRVNHWIDGPACQESAIIEQILGQAFCERGRGGQGVLVDPLHAIADPLDRLNEQGLQLVAVVSRGLYTLPSWSGFLRQIDFERPTIWSLRTRATSDGPTPPSPRRFTRSVASARPVMR